MRVYFDTIKLTYVSLMMKNKLSRTKWQRYNRLPFSSVFLFMSGNGLVKCPGGSRSLAVTWQG